MNARARSYSQRVTEFARATGHGRGEDLASLDRAVWRLAVPAFFALITEPLFLLADAAVVGRLGTPQLAGLGIAGVVLHSIVGLGVFLAYGTTASVARQRGAGNSRAALAQGIDGIWLAVGVGTAMTVTSILAARPLVEAFGASELVTDHAVVYLRIAAIGAIPLAVMLAAVGVLRGFQDIRTPLLVAVVGNALNVILNVVLVFGAGLGLAGSALGSVIAQLGAAAAMVAIVVRNARRERVGLRPRLPGIRMAAASGVPLVVRTVTLRAAILVTTGAVALGAPGRDADLAAHQLAFTIWTFLAFTLDAIAIAAQTLTGHALGAGDNNHALLITRRMMWWGIVSGFITGAALALASPWLGLLFTEDPFVRELLLPVLLVAAVGQPIAGLVFVLDGILIGAGDGRYLASAGVAVLLLYVPVALVVAMTVGGLVGIWVTFTAVFMGSRCVTLVYRHRTGGWLGR
jgi:putative MATE family efflux protein